MTTALIWCPFPDREIARTVSATLVEEELIGCANILGEMEAVFRWKGAIDTGLEVPVLFKTSSKLLERAIERLGELHPYEAPAILGWLCDAAHPSTSAWLGSLG